MINVNISITLILVLCSIGCNCANTTELLNLSTSHLPLSDWLQKKFPKIKSKYFIISSPQIGIIVHENNSNIQIRCGSFSKIILSVAILKTYSKLKFIKNKDLYKYNGNKIKLIEKFLLPFYENKKKIVLI